MRCTRWYQGLLCGLAVAACADDRGGTAQDASTGATEATSSSSDAQASTGDHAASSAADDGSAASDGSSADASTGGSDTGGSDTGGSGTDGTGSGEDSTTGEAMACTVDPPPPGACKNPGAGGGGNPAAACDVFAQDCPADQKCMPWADDGGSSWNATTCSPIADTPAQVGEPCTALENGVSGLDDCALGAMCWNVDPETNTGVCIELCSCSAETPTCATPGTSCVIANEDVLALCIPACNPLDPEACPDGGCYAVGDMFHCAPDASGNAGGPGDPCMYINVCDPGLSCVTGDIVPGCDAINCCSSLCSIGDDDPCLPGQQCAPFYDEGGAPDPCLAEVGVCASP